MTDVTVITSAEREERELRREAFRLVRDGWVPCKGSRPSIRVALAGRVSEIALGSQLDGVGMIRYERGDESCVLPVPRAVVERYLERGAELSE